MLGKQKERGERDTGPKKSLEDNLTGVGNDGGGKAFKRHFTGSIQ